VSEGNGNERPTARERIGFLAGPAALAICLLTPPPGGLGELEWRTAGLGLLMAAWWITEAIPIYVTALLPLVLLPLLGIASIGDAAAPFANPVIYLFMGGFVIAAALEACGLHRRMAVAIIRAVGTRPASLIGGFMAATAFISMWVSNTATVVMLLPMATSVILAVESNAGGAGGPEERNFSVALLLGLSYAASIGGVGTLIGTPPTALLAGFMAENYGVRIGFAQWMLVGVPVVLVGVPLTWLLLTRVLHPVGNVEIRGGREYFDREAGSLGPMTRAEKTVATITALTALGWLTQPLLERVVPQVSDAGIAMTGAVLMFLVPVDWKRGRFALEWKQAERMPWSVLVLFGGGLSLAGAIQSTGLAASIGNAMAALGGLPVVFIMLAVTIVVVFLTELTSNTATAATFLPVVASVSAGMGRSPLLLAVPAAMAAGLSFMLPAGTPPNALVFGTGRLSIPVMARAGILLNLLFVIIVNAVVLGIALHVFGLNG